MRHSTDAAVKSTMSQVVILELLTMDNTGKSTVILKSHSL